MSTNWYHYGNEHQATEKRETDRQTDRDRYIERDRQTDRQTETETETERLRGRATERKRLSGKKREGGEYTLDDNATPAVIDLLLPYFCRFVQNTKVVERNPTKLASQHRVTPLSCTSSERSKTSPESNQVSRCR